MAADQWRWVDLAVAALDPSAAPPAYAEVGELLTETFGATVTFHGTGTNYRQAAAPVATVRAFPSGRLPERVLAEIGDFASTEAHTVHPLVRYYRASLLPVPMQVADVPEAIVDADARNLWLALSAPWGVQDQLAIPIEFGIERQHAYVIARDRPFDAGEVNLAGRLQRLLVALDRGNPAPTPAGAPPVSLTERQLMVLGLLAEGLTAVAVARRLAMAERTVNKHLANIYARLGCHDRVSAVRTAERLGMLPPVRPPT